jgi:ferritin-like protein
MLLNHLKTEFDGSYAVQERRIQDFGGDNPRERDQLEELGVG